MYSEYVTAGLWGSVNVFLPAMIAFSGWQVFVRYALASAEAPQPVVVVDQDDKL